jgi:5-methylcytosine-specific restriction endonuclease McrA
MKVCSKCKIVEVSKSGARCSECNKAYMRAYKEQNAEKIREGLRDHYQRNKERVKARVKAYADANKVKVKESKAITYQKYRDARLATIAAWQAANPERYKTIQRSGILNRIARKRGADGKFTAADIRALGEHQNWRCANPLCACDLTNGYDIDHQMPLSRGGSNWPTNLQLLCGSCNRRKGALTMLEFMARLTRPV